MDDTRTAATRTFVAGPSVPQVYREAEFNSMEQLHEGNRFVTIRRKQLLFDGFDRLSALGESLKGRVRIQFVSEHGEPEAGVVSAFSFFRTLTYQQAGNF